VRRSKGRGDRQAARSPSRGGKSVTVRVEAVKCCPRKALARSKKLKVTLALTAADAAGNSKSSIVKLTLKPARTRKR